jgi:hypothetical protein
MNLDIGRLGDSFRTTGAKDHPFFWVHGACNFIPNMLKLVNLVSPPTKVHYSEFENKNSEVVKGLIIDHGSDKHFHNYHVLYSYILDPTISQSILEIGLGTRNPEIASTMYFYEQSQNFVNTPGGSLRFFRDYCPNAHVYGADVDRDILFQEDRIETSYVDQLDCSSLRELFKNRMFDIIIDDGLHHLSSNLNTLIEALDHVNVGGYIVIEDISIPDNWLLIDFVVSRIPNLETKLIDFDSGSYIYLIKKL